MYEAIKRYYQRVVPGLTDEEWAALERCLTVRQVPRGGFVVREGQVCRHVSFVESGLVRFFYSVDGKEISMGFMGSGEYISEYESFLTGRPSAQNIEALADTEVIDLGHDDMQALYRRYPRYQEFGRRIAEGLYLMLSQRTTSLLVLSPEERYRQMVATQPRLLQQVPQYMLASYIGITPEHLSRIRKKLASREG